MSEITRYLLLDADGADASEETERFDDVERWAQAASAPVAIVARVYEYTHTEMVRWCWWRRKSAAKWRTAICACSDHRCG